jgi:hypothetical protein
MVVISMKQLSIAFFITVIFLTGCINKEEDKASSPSISSSQPALATSSPTTTETEKTGQPIATFFSESQDKQLLIYENMNSTSPLTAQITDKSGSTKNRSNIPTQKDWEKGFRKDNIFASIHSDSNINWILLTSDPAAGLMGKTLYKTSDNGKSWVLVNDVSLIVDGYVTGVTFRDDKNGWIGATQHGAALVPLYRTKDGGQTWSLQELSIPKGYKYGNVYPPIFDEKDIKQGTLKIEFVSDTDKTTMEFTTTDGGETWKSYTNTGESDSANVNLTDNEVKDILKGLIPKAVAIYGTFNGNGAFKSDATKTIPGEKDYCLVTGIRQQNGNGKSPVDLSNVKSIKDLKKVAEDVFTKDAAQKLFYSRYLETKDISLPLYKDYEGQLYENTKNGGHGWATKFLIDTAKLKGQKDNAAEIELDTTVLDDPYGTLIIKIEYVNGKWLMASGVDDYKSIIIPVPKNLNASSLSIPMQPQWHLNVVNEKYSDIIDDKGLKIGWISASNYEKDFDFKQVKPNHSSIIHEESFNIPIGKCDFFTLDVDNGSAASGLTGTHNEYYAVIQIENKVIYIMSFSLNDKKDETKQKFIDILKKTRLKDTLN